MLGWKDQIKTTNKTDNVTGKINRQYWKKGDSKDTETGSNNIVDPST